MINTIDNKEAVKLLEKHFDSAMETKDGVKKLRELILTLAMQGKLVKQNANDQPVTQLLIEIDRIKKSLFAEGKIKKPKSLAPVSTNEIPYSVPHGWTWCRLPDIADSCLGKMLDAQKNQGNLHSYLRNTNVRWFSFDLSDLKQIKVQDYELEKCSAQKGDLLLCEGGYPGRGAIWKSDEPIVIQKAIHRVRFFILEHNLWFLYFLSLLDRSRKIEQYFTGAGIQHLTGDKLKTIFIPLPPLPEQRRIVAKITHLMSLCDKLESQRNERSNKRLAIHTAAINKLLAAPDKSEFNSSWKFISKNFSELYSVKENVEELKKAILQLAVMGKLVKQDPKDQPAGELLREIEEEKKRLVKDGLIKKQKLLPVNKLAVVPYALPKNWEWCRIREICHDWGQKTPDKKFTYIDVGAIDNTKGIITSNVQLLDSSEAPSRARKIVKNGTVIYSTVRPYLLNIAILEEEYSKEPIASTAFAILHPYEGIYNRYIYYYLHSNPFIDYVNLQMKGVAYPAINDGNFFQGPFPLPPLAEQRRIVSKIDHLMSLCNTLVHQINNSTDKQTAILDAVLSKI